MWSVAVVRRTFTQESIQDAGDCWNHLWESPVVSSLVWLWLGWKWVSFAALPSNMPWRWFCAVFTNEEHLIVVLVFFLPQKYSVLGNFPGQTEEADGQCWHDGLSEMDLQSTHFNGGSTCGQIHWEPFLFTKCWMIESLSWKMIALL